MTPMDLQQAKLRVFKAEYNRRKSQNPQYSQRAFAKNLGVSHALLSMIYSGKRPLSAKLVKKLLLNCDLQKEQKDMLKIGLPQSYFQERNLISLELFERISTWVHYAIMSLAELEEFQWNDLWIAKRLGAEVTEVKNAMEDLIEANLIAKAEDGSYRFSSAPLSVASKSSTDATKSYNRDIMDKAMESMYSDKTALREMSSIVFTLDPEYIPYVVERIQNFRRSLSQELENLGDNKEVYALSTQIFPLSKVRSSK